MCIFYSHLTVKVDLWSASISRSCFLTGFGCLSAIHHISRFSSWFSFCSGAKLFLFQLSDPFTFLVIRTRAAPGVRRPTSLGWILAVWLYLFTFRGTFFCSSLKSRWNVGLRVQWVHYIFPAFLFPLCVLSILQLPRKHCPAFPKFKTHYWILVSG